VMALPGLPRVRRASRRPRVTRAAVAAARPVPGRVARLGAAVPALGRAGRADAHAGATHARLVHAVCGRSPVTVHVARLHAIVRARRRTRHAASQFGTDPASNPVAEAAAPRKIRTPLPVCLAALNGPQSTPLGAGGADRSRVYRDVGRRVLSAVSAVRPRAAQARPAAATKLAGGAKPSVGEAARRRDPAATIDLAAARTDGVVGAGLGRADDGGVRDAAAARC
jgi:hypothetical protein